MPSSAAVSPAPKTVTSPGGTCLALLQVIRLFSRYRPEVDTGCEDKVAHDVWMMRVELVTGGLAAIRKVPLSWKAL